MQPLPYTHDNPCPTTHFTCGRNDRRSKVDIGRFEDASKEIEEVLGTKLYAVAKHPGQLGECFRDAQELVESAGVLLGCPENEQDGCVPSKYHTDLARDDMTDIMFLHSA